MPYKSDQQRKFMHARHPEIASRWDAEIRAKKKDKKVSKAEIFKAYARKDNHEPSSAAAKVGAAYGAAGGLYAGHRVGARTAGTTYSTVRRNKAFASSQIAGRYGRDAANSVKAKRLINNAVPGAKAAKGGGILGTAVGAAGGAAYAHHKEKQRVGQVNAKAKAFNKKHGVNYVAKSFEVNTEIFKAAGDRKSDVLGAWKAPFHAKKGRKLAVTGRTEGRAILTGSVAGAGAGLATHALTRGRAPGLAHAANIGGGTVGGLAGQRAAFRNARKRGDIKIGKALDKPKNTTSGTLKKIGGTGLALGGAGLAARGARGVTAGARTVRGGFGMRGSAGQVSGNPGLKTNMYNASERTISAGRAQQRSGAVKIGSGLGLGLAGSTTFNSGKKNQFKR